MKEEEIAEQRSLKLQEQLEPVVARCESLVIGNDTEMEKAAQWIVSLKDKKGEIEAARDSIVKPLHLAHKNAISFFRRPLEVVELAVRTLNRKLITYETTQHDKRRKEEEERRAKAQAEFEQKRKELEAKAKAAEKGGDREMAAEYRDAAPSRPQPVEASEEPTPMPIAGLSRRQTWKARVVDAAKVPHEYRKCVPDVQVLNAYARSHGKEGRIAGVEFYADKQLVRGK